MFGFYNKEKFDVFTKSQENLEKCQEVLEKSQENLDKIMQMATTNNTLVLGNSFQTENAPNLAVKAEKDKRKAAYALNLCTVSVSQIIDYNDVYFLENEYNTILNNLNLEEMPKDEALLRILKQLLDVITFFRIQEGDKKMQEYAYQQKLKNAVWSAIPNPAVILAGGSPVNMAISLASQVGIGYLNYRKEKAKIVQEEEEKQWELQRSAIEQFNALRRELFDTAWRLADEYNFPDNYRLTENQITQFNKILQDSDNIRRFERLSYIKDRFEAYPPFWYYLGSAANAIYQDKTQNLELRESYKNDAIQSFDKFFELTESNLLREDQLIASCALEKFDLIEDKDEKIKLLTKAENSTTALDVLQMCAISYLKIGETSQCCKLLKMLVNEEYNEALNAQLLSKLYVSAFSETADKELQNNYKMLELRVDSEILYPMPEDNENECQLENNFIEQQREVFVVDAVRTLELYIKNCEKEYKERFEKSQNPTKAIADLINKMNGATNKLLDEVDKDLFVYALKSSGNALDNLKNMLEKYEQDERKKHFVSFVDVFKDSFAVVAKYLHKTISTSSDMDDISILESKLFEFKIAANMNAVKKKNKKTEENDESIEDILFDKSFNKRQICNQKINDILDVFERLGISNDTLMKNGNAYEFYKRDKLDFNRYINDNKKRLERRNINLLEIVAVLDKKNDSDNDIIFTISGIYKVGISNRIGNHFSAYKDITLDKHDYLKIGSLKFKCEINVETWEVLRNELSLLCSDANDESENQLSKIVGDIIKGLPVEC